MLLQQAALTDDHKQFLRQALKSYEALTTEVGQDEETRAGVARAQLRVGTILHWLGQYPEAERALRRAFDLHKQRLDGAPGHPGHRHDLANIHNDLGNALASAGRSKNAEDEYRAALRLQKELAADPSAPPSYIAALARTYNNLGILLAGINHAKEAEAEYRTALDLYNG